MVPSHRILIWHPARQFYELDEQGKQQFFPLTGDEEQLVAWLESISSFSFQGQQGHLTLRKEARRRGDQYWYAYRRVGPRMVKKYLGRSATLTLARLEEMAAAFPPAASAHSFPVVEQPLPQEESGHEAPATGEAFASPHRQAYLPSNPLLATKLHPPRPRSRFIPRPRLTLRLQEGMEHALTLVSAPAGFGKTTLLTQWLTESETPCAWLSLDPEENDPERFLTYLLVALQTALPDLSMTVLRLLEAAAASPMESVLTVLTNDVINREIPDFALVLDDYHVITNPAIHQGLLFLVNHLPPHMHLILASRADPPFPLASLRASGRLVELRTNDLRLDATEMQTFLQGMLELDLPTEALEAIESRTEGWVAGLQLAALSLRGRTDIPAFVAAFNGSHRFVLDYLSEEVLLRQPTQVQSFLLRTSILERQCGSLCEAVTGQDEGQAMLEALERANLFVVPLDEERHWYRYHQLFAEVLVSRLQQTSPTLIPELHRQASLWYEEHAQPIEAVQHALTAQDPERAVRLIEHSALMVIAAGRSRTLLEWLQALPDALVRAHPFLCVCSAGALHLNDQVEEAEALFAEAERALEAGTSIEHTGIVRALAAVARANIARYSGDLARYVALGQQALDILPAVWPQEYEVMRGVPTIQAAASFLVSGDVTGKKEQQVKDAVTTAHTSGYGQVHFRSLTLLARMHVLQGRLREAAASYEEAGHQVISGLQVLEAMTPIVSYCFEWGDVLREWNRLDEAERLLAQGMELVSEKRSVFADDLLLGYLTLARLQHARGEVGECLATLDTLIQLGESRQFVPQMKATARAALAQMALLQGHLAEAIHWADESGLSPEDTDLPYLSEPAYLVLARVCIARGREDPAGPHLSNALRLLERLLSDAEAKARMGSTLEILVLQALALSAKRDRASALMTLQRALTLAQPQGYLRLFVDEGTPMLTLLREIQLRGVMPEYVATLLSAFGTQHQASAAPSIHSPGQLLEPLTAREREVLQLLSEGASNREIARRLVLSTGTVKKYVYNICGKLSVQSRTQALARARTLHLL